MVTLASARHSLSCWRAVTRITDRPGSGGAAKVTTSRSRSRRLPAPSTTCQLTSTPASIARPRRSLGRHRMVQVSPTFTTADAGETATLYSGPACS